MPKPKREGATKTQVNINRLQGDASLVEKRMIRPRLDSPTKIAIVILVLGVLVGGGALGYFFGYRTLLRADQSPQIVIPDSMQTARNKTPAPNTETVPFVPSDPAPLPVKHVTILDTPTGYLNVRKGAGTNFEKVAQIKPGQQYELLAESANKGWLEINISPTQTGWISAKYASVK